LVIASRCLYIGAAAGADEHQPGCDTSRDSLRRVEERLLGMDRGSSTLNSEFKDFETFAFVFYRLRSCLLVFDVPFLLPSPRFWYCFVFNDLLFTTLPQPPSVCSHVILAKSCAPLPLCTYLPLPSIFARQAYPRL